MHRTPEEIRELQWKALLMAAWRTELALEMELRELRHDMDAFRVRIGADWSQRTIILVDESTMSAIKLNCVTRLRW